MLIGWPDDEKRIDFVIFLPAILFILLLSFIQMRFICADLLFFCLFPSVIITLTLEILSLDSLDPYDLIAN